MRRPTHVLAPRHFSAFRCLGTDCEDTCCDGWAVAIDKPTYEKYRHCSDPQWRASFEKLIVVNPSFTDYDYARIQLSGTACPFLSEGLCSIHKNLGEAYLSVTCASFPRVWNVVDDVLEKSLDVGCPEAARLVLLDPDAMTMEQTEAGQSEFSLARVAAVDTSDPQARDKPYRLFGAVRPFVLWILRNRTLPIWKRLVILGLFCDKVHELVIGGASDGIPALIPAYRDAVSAGAFDGLLAQCSGQPQLRLETSLELIVARISSDFTNRRFLQLYKQFMDGLQWTKESTFQQLAARHAEAAAKYYAPFVKANDYLLENYLVNFVYRSLFPFGPQESTYGLRTQNIQRSIHAEFMLLAAYYAAIETLLIGLAAFYREAFGGEQVVDVVYTFTRTFEHSLTFPARILQSLDEKRLHGPAGVAVLARTTVV